MTGQNGRPPRSVAIQVRDLPLPFPIPLLTAPHPGGSDCMCTWVWSEEKGGEKTPWCLKFRNSWCPIHPVRRKETIKHEG